MGRPLLSTLIDSPSPAVRVAQPESAPQTPKIDFWSYNNPFDPDSEQFWDSDDAVYEAPMPLGAQGNQEGAASDVDADYVRVEVSEPSALRRRILRAAQAADFIGATPPAADESARPELVPSSENDSSSDGLSSGRSSPDVEALEVLDAHARRDIVWGIVHESEHESAAQQPTLESTILTPPADSLAHSDDDHVEPFPSMFQDEDHLVFDSDFENWFGSERGIPELSAPASPRPRPAEAVNTPLTPPPAPRGAIDIPLSRSPRAMQAAGSPMTPPGSVTPRFLTWGASGGMRPRAVDMSPSPTQAAPLGSLRSSRLFVPYLSSSALRVHQ